ncbi:MAG: aminotransferase class III-fold pyridoxal phosphate-dependent enzyme, partial [Gordonia sp.]|nr:aminotransferase class III-fold pyridoxal phosphate-dependent enzyme [Gordonia sp. (in: high G+C Gram-positive bacteria)]
SHRGRGMVQGLVFEQAELADRACEIAFGKGLLAETSGPYSEVVKLLPPLTITSEELAQGLAILSDAVDEALAERE